ncbi:MAG TPA: class I SAM-dependent methyltransferase [Rhizomicrobium sp.]|jgi:cyclopropane fatty-acyl-phospholipid synthase-like methyltransferase|nr:class I SAM-dependent methyltransferase [Rhizomicrobium sp.]
MKQAYWNRLADDFATDVCDITREESDDLVRHHVAMARTRRKHPVLIDLGCGVGTFIERYGRRFSNVIGVEFAPRIIAHAARRCAGVENVTWKTMDIPRAAKELEGCADLTVCMNVITSASAAKRAALWSSLAQVTRKEGHALVVVPSLESEWFVRTMMRGALDAIRPGGLVKRDDAWQKHYERAELDRVFSGCGFALRRVDRAYYPWGIEGLRETAARRAKRPWDWMCLARRL